MNKTVRTFKTIARRVLHEDVDTTVGRLTATHERHMALLEDALTRVTPGTKIFLEHVKVIEEMENRFTELMQSLSVLPRSLGNSTITRFEFSSRSGIMPASGRSVDQFNPDSKVIAGEFGLATPRLTE